MTICLHSSVSMYSSYLCVKLWMASYYISESQIVLDELIIVLQYFSSPMGVLGLSERNVYVCMHGCALSWLPPLG